MILQFLFKIEAESINELNENNIGKEECYTKHKITSVFKTYFYFLLLIYLFHSFFH